jgi:hypothetical protein
MEYQLARFIAELSVFFISFDKSAARLPTGYAVPHASGVLDHGWV